MDKILNARQVAERLGLSIRTVYRLIDDGSIEFVRLRPRRVGVRESVLERWVEERSQQYQTPNKGGRNAEKNQ